MTIDEVISTKTYVKDRSSIQFLSPAGYINPFLDIISSMTSEFTVKTGMEVKNANEDDTENVAYGRVVIEAKLPSKFDVEDHGSVFGMVYALDLAKPMLKVYSGKNAHACTNLCIFGADDIYEVSLTGDVQSAYDRVGDFIGEIDEQQSEFRRKIQALKSKVYVGSEIDTKIGEVLRTSMRNRIGTSPIIFAVKELLDSKSVYAVRGNQTSAWNFMSAITQFLTDKGDIFDKPDKTLAVASLFKQELN